MKDGPDPLVQQVRTSYAYRMSAVERKGAKRNVLIALKVQTEH